MISVNPSERTLVGLLGETVNSWKKNSFINGKYTLYKEPWVWFEAQVKEALEDRYDSRTRGGVVVGGSFTSAS